MKLAELLRKICPANRGQCRCRFEWTVDEDYIAVDLFVTYGALRVPLDTDFVYLHEVDKRRLPEKLRQKSECDGRVKAVTMYCEVLIARSYTLFERKVLPPLAIRTNVLTLIYWIYRYGLEEKAEIILGRVKGIFSSPGIESAKRAVARLLEEVLYEIAP